LGLITTIYIFGFDKYLSNQEKIILSVLNKKNVLTVMPTGSGKSLLYKLPSLLFDGLTLVISPLISLMKDQVDELNQLGIEARSLNSSHSPAENNNTINLIKNNKFYIQSGAGIVADSIPEKEYLETINKAKALINSLN